MSNSYSNTVEKTKEELRQHAKSLNGEPVSADRKESGDGVPVGSLNAEAQRQPADLKEGTHTAASLKSHRDAAEAEHERQKQEPLSLPIDADHVREKIIERAKSMLNTMDNRTSGK
ncbi:MAG TPA: hypothetical protein VEH30_14460 [Terriglobales bacterium]|nr:hypothetical protein [Terriglobales bacterium]